MAPIMWIIMKQAVLYFFSFKQRMKTHKKIVIARPKGPRQSMDRHALSERLAMTGYMRLAIRQDEEGFSLLELAIVLVILGTIGGMSLPLLTAHLNRTALQKTRSHQEYILDAIAAFVEKNHRFPCPADTKATGSTQGVSQIHCRGEKAKGIVPFKTLGISEAYAKDGFKRLMIYVVEPELAKKDTTLQNEQGGLITVKSEENISVLAPPLVNDENPNYIALVLISQSQTLPSQKHEKEKNGFVFQENHQTDTVLRWESRDQFLKHYVNSISAE
jgi:prepilin-type N-terminal cleavage/methylation domain-containing protein